jgi:hypothetical protein
VRASIKGSLKLFLMVGTLGVAAVGAAPPAEARAGGGGGGRAFVGGDFRGFRGGFIAGGSFRGGGFVRGGGGAQSGHPMASHFGGGRSFGGGGFGFPASAVRRFAAPIDQAPDSRRFAGHPAPQGGPDDRIRAVAAGQDDRSREFRHGQFSPWLFRREFVGWAGPVFWPYAYDQLLDALLEPEANQFWAYGYGDLFAGVLYPNVSDNLTADYVATAGYGLDVIAATVTTPQPPAVGAESSLSQLCVNAQPISNAITIERMKSVLQPNSDQFRRLEALEAAEASAAKDLAASCETQKPATPVARLDAVQTRLQQLIEATNLVAAPLGQFYGSLTDEQKARVNQFGETPQQQTSGTAEQTYLTGLCGPETGVPVVPIGQIENAVQPNAQQRAQLAEASEAANVAEQAILEACPEQAPLTPPGRLRAIEYRLQAMLHGVEQVRLPLERFWASLDKDQQIRFDGLQGRG